ncbi:MAG TPA: hypothetical protein VK716_02900 [Terracidiphilus sp.]|jgi:hypothetical protein|nr:hypothetical protein [Terracidiphilus sp.]
MSTIAGQINNFNFSSVSAGVADPNLGNNVEGIFEAAWESQIGGDATVAASNSGGNEHLRATFGSTSTLPAIAADLALPAGAAFAFEYSIDETVAELNGDWILATAANGRIDQNGNPDPTGQGELTGMTLVSSADTWTTVITGIYHTGARLPNVPFTITREETLTVLGDAVGGSFTLLYNVYPASITMDLRALRSAITALEVLGVGAIGALLFGPAVVPLLGWGDSEIEAYIASQMQPVVVPFQPLQNVYSAIPQRLQLPGTTDNLWFDYNMMSFPQGTIAKGVVPADEVVAQMPGAVLTFSGSALPQRARRVAFVMITGPSTVSLPILPAQRGATTVGSMSVQYSALHNDEVVSPTFQWSVTGANGQGIPSVVIGNPTEATITLLFKATPAEKVRITVRMDDAQHLKDANGNTPTASIEVSVLHVALPKPVQGTGIPKPIRVTTAA